MDQSTSRTDAAKAGTTGVAQTAEGQSLSPQTNVNKATNRPGTSRGSTQQKGASFSGPANQTNQKTGRRNTNSS